MSNDDQDISHRNVLRTCKRRMEIGSTKCNIDKGVCGENQYQELSGACDMMIQKSSPGIVIHLRIDLSIYLLQQEALENVESYQEVVDENDTDNERAEGSQA